MVICGRKTGYISDFFSNYVDMDIKKIRLSKPNSTQQTVCKNNKNIRSKSSSLAIFHYFYNGFFRYIWLGKTDFVFAQFDIFLKEETKHSYWRFLSQKAIYDGQF